MGIANRYIAYGEAISVTASGCEPEARGYIGVRLDSDTGLIDLHARWYDPVLGRFTSPDWWFDSVDQDSAALG